MSDTLFRNPSATFSRYEGFAPKAEVRCVSRPGVPSIHRFYDTSPVSPSGRYIAITEFDYEDRLPQPGEQAHVAVIDLTNGETVYRRSTRGWDTQLGAQVQWGASDNDLFFNDLSTADWLPFGLKVNIFTGSELRLEHTVYMVSPDGSLALSPCLRRIGLIQPGYGVIVPKEHIPVKRGAAKDDGIYCVDTQTGQARLLVSIHDIVTARQDVFGKLDLQNGSFYGFHVKWSPSGQRIMFILRWKAEFSARRSSQNYLVTLKADGSDIQVAITPQVWQGGHHPNWCPDDEHIVMNLTQDNPRLPFPRLIDLAVRALRRLRIRLPLEPKLLRLCSFRYDGSDRCIISQRYYGSGHPTWLQHAPAVLTDAYNSEPVAYADGTVPLRLINVLDNSCTEVVRIHTLPAFFGPKHEWRVDPHPAWDRTGYYIAFNANPDGCRGVYIADMRQVIAAQRKAA